MRTFPAILMIALWLGPVARAEPAADAIEDVISDQIAAFRADDFATAFTFASPGIQRLFGTHERLGQMVRNGYPMVWRPEDLRYLDLRGAGTARQQIVEIVDRAGQVHRLEYSMVRTASGWRIDGVRVLEAAPPLT
ncbi:protein of unknown function [Rhodovulum sp. ES.010]|uniref:DUF4864 domain-containing protein n=1 Tax=Rhodovulum sp. ES.010 TaxID=1882821 RepID=UPI00092915A3|nr:DUF4864 domain-containing protein [Rhodovulum sp. ES.010]SIO52987.1 protein of unknown function [Rhodovulum sp. ES.010]